MSYDGVTRCGSQTRTESDSANDSVLTHCEAAAKLGVAPIIATMTRVKSLWSENPQDSAISDSQSAPLGWLHSVRIFEPTSEKAKARQSTGFNRVLCPAEVGMVTAHEQPKRKREGLVKTLSVMLDAHFSRVPSRDEDEIRNRERKS